MNPDFWDHGVDQSVFQGWMRMSEVSCLLSFVVLFTDCDLSFSSGFMSDWLSPLRLLGGLWLVIMTITSICGRRSIRT